MTKTEERALRIELSKQFASVLDGILADTIEDSSRLRQEVERLHDTLLSMAHFSSYCILSGVE